VTDFCTKSHNNLLDDDEREIIAQMHWLGANNIEIQEMFGL